MDNNAATQFDPRTIAWAREHVPASWMIRLLALAGYFSRHPQLAFFAIDLRRDITNASPEQVSTLTSVDVSERVVTSLASLDFALGAAFVYASQRYALLYPHRPTAFALAGQTQEYIDHLQAISGSPAEHRFGDIPFTALMPDDIIELTPEERERYQMIYDEISRPSIDEETGLPRTAVFQDLRCLAPAEAWSQLGIVAVTGSSSVIPAAITAGHAYNDLTAARLQQFWRQVNCHEPPERMMSREEIIRWLEGLHDDWFRIFTSTLPVPTWFTANTLGLLPPLPLEQQLTFELLHNVLENPALEPPLPAHVLAWTEHGTSLDMNRPLDVRAEYDERWRRYLQSHGIEV